MRPTVLLLLPCAVTSAFAQIDTTTLTLDKLRAPSSPGSVLLGVAESDIQRPTDPAEFMASIRQATSDFSQLPKNYAVDFAPLLLWGKTRNAVDLMSLDPVTLNARTNKQQKFSETFAQTFVLSFAVKDLGTGGATESTDAITADPRMGLGLKFSVFRGKQSGESEKQFKALDKIIDDVALRIATNVAALTNDDPGHKQLFANATALPPGSPASLAWFVVLAEYDAKLSDLHREASDPLEAYEELKSKEAQAKTAGQVDSYNAYKMAREFFGNQLARIDHLGTLAKHNEMLSMADRAYQLASDLKSERVGFFWDWAGGLVLDYRDRRFDNSKMTRAGGWTTFGYTGPKGAFTYQGQLRFLHNPDDAFTDEADSLNTGEVNMFDGGARLSWDPKNGRFSLSAEALYRTILNVDGIDPTWRLVANTEYDLGNNKRLTFSFGRNFDGTTTKSGNLVTALNLVLGFGGKTDRVN